MPFWAPFIAKLAQSRLTTVFLVEFRHSYEQRQRYGRRDVPSTQRDPAIAHSLEMIIDAATSLLKAGYSPADIGSVIPVACERAIGTSSVAIDEYGNIHIEANSLGSIRFIVARMGAVTRTSAFDSSWRSVDLPREFSWNTPWDLTPKLLPSGLVLMDEEGVEVMGSRDGVRLVWLRVKGRKAFIVSRFEGTTILDDLPPTIRGNRVSLTTADEPKSFFSSQSEIELPRRRTWDCTYSPKLVVNEALLPGVRAMDNAIWNAWHARHRTLLQGSYEPHGQIETIAAAGPRRDTERKERFALGAF